MFPKWLAPLTWAWAIIVGGLLLIPPGVICIRCGPSAPGYLGDPVVIVIAVVSIALGALGFAGGMRSKDGPTQ